MKPKLVNTKIYLSNANANSSSEKSFEHAWFEKGRVSELLVRDAIQNGSIVWDPIPGQSVIPDDSDIEELHSIIFPEYRVSDIFSGHIIRLVFDPVVLARHSLSFGNVISILREAVGDGITTSCVYSDNDACTPVFRIRARFSSQPVDRDHHTGYRRMELAMMQRFFHQQVEDIYLSGIEGVRNVFIKEDRRDGGLMLDTDCRSLIDAMAVSDSVDGRCECNHPLEVYHTLGVEAARQAIIVEIRKVYMYYGINVDARHLTLIADAMTSAGGMMPINRHGINHAEDYGTLKRAAFEEIQDVLIKAAVSAKCDPLTDNTSRIMIGQEVRVGTGTFDLLLDRERHEDLSRQYNQPRRRRQYQQRRRKQAIDSHMAALDKEYLVKDRAKERLDPMSLAEFQGTGFGFDDMEEEEVADEYSPSRPYSPSAATYSPTSPSAYSPTSPSAKYSPTSPSLVYDPAAPRIRVEPIPYDPERSVDTDLNTGLWDDDDADAGLGDGEDDLGW